MSKLKAFLEKLIRFANAPWYAPVIGFVAFSDFYIFVIPTDAVLISSSLAVPRKWKRYALWITIGSSLGAFTAALAFMTFAENWFSAVLVETFGAQGMEAGREFLQNWGGLALFLSSVGPLPVHPAVFAAAAAKISPLEILLWVGVGRMIKYTFLSWAASHAPHLIFSWKKKM